MSNYKIMNECLACGSDNLYPYLDLGKQALANEYHRCDGPQDEYPLGVNLCKDCFHTQLTTAVSPEILYRNYLYVSGTTKTLNEYFKNFVKLVEFKNANKSLKVMDIGSNDGSLLKEFQKLGHKVLGVDPARNLAEIANKDGVETIPEFWTNDLAKKIDRELDIIVAMNVFAHNSNPHDFLLGCKEVLAENGSIFIQTSQANIFKNGEFDTIYHEHHSFFTMKSFLAIAKRVGLKIVDVSKPSIHGTSYLVEFKHFGEPAESVQELLNLESSWGYYELSTYDDFSAKAHYCVDETKKILNEYIEKGYQAVAYGAAAKGNTFLNFSKIKCLDYIIDDNTLKVDLYSPGSDILIKGIDQLAANQEKPLIILVLAWNFYDEIVSRIQKVRKNKNDVIFKYFPEPKLESLQTQSDEMDLSCH